MPDRRFSSGSTPAVHDECIASNILASNILFTSAAASEKNPPRQSQRHDGLRNQAPEPPTSTPANSAKTLRVNTIRSEWSPLQFSESPSIRVLTPSTPEGLAMKLSHGG